MVLTFNFCPHSSPDPFGATRPPGEGMGFFDTLTPVSLETGVQRVNKCRPSECRGGGGIIEFFVPIRRADPMVLFYLRPLRTNWLSALPAYLVPKMRSPASPRPGMIYLCSFRRSSQAAM